MKARRDEGGFTTIWFLGLVLVFLMIGGISLDLWRAFSERRAIAEMVDAAADAGAGEIDQEAYRNGIVALDPPRAEGTAQANLESQGGTRSLTGADISATPQAITVRGHGVVHFTLLRVFMADDPFEIEVTSVAEPRASQ